MEIGLLDGFATEAIEHFGRRLHDHLVGTWRILRDWGAPVHLCRAGLFHAVYGTGTFPAAALPPTERDVRFRVEFEDEIPSDPIGKYKQSVSLLRSPYDEFDWPRSSP